MNSDSGGYESAVTVDLSAIAHNVRHFKSIAPDCLLMAVVKADAYGHGSVRGNSVIAAAAVAAGADMLGVAHVGEGVSLRKNLGQNGRDTPILAWLHTKSTNFRQALDYGLMLGVSAGWELEAIAAAAKSTGTKPKIHLKIDTGLGRNGSTAKQWPLLVEHAKNLHDRAIVDVTGIFSHFSVADEPGNPETARQLSRFQEAVRYAQDAGLTEIVRHMANTPAALSLPDSHLDMIRIGLGIYGLSPFTGQTGTSHNLKPAMALSTQVAQVKEAPAGQGVSYGLTYVTDRPTRLGLIPLGYGDGIPRDVLQAPVLIRGKTYFSVGRVAMDQFVVDLGTDAEACAGDVAVLFGGAEPSGGGARVAVEEWARAASTINYEIVTRIGSRVPRVYKGGPNRQEVRWEAYAISRGSAQTQALAEKLAGALKAGDLVILNGDLGAGKTTFTQGLGRALGIRGQSIISPTFVLARYYKNPDGDRPDLTHVDAYRLGSGAEVDDLDLEYTMDHSVTVVEWGGGKAEHLSASRLVVDIVYDPENASEPDGDVRRVTVRGYGERWQKPLDLS